MIKESMDKKRIIFKTIEEERSDTTRLIKTNPYNPVKERPKEALKESEERFRDLYEEAPLAYLTVNTAGIIQECNKMAEEILGQTRDHLIGKDLLGLFADAADDQQKVETRYRSLFQGDPIRNKRVQLIRRDGTIIWGSLTINNIKDGERKTISSRCMVSDITDHVQLEAQLLQAQKMESLGTLAGGIAHDFNNLLMGVQGRTSLMLMGTDPSHPHFEHLKGIEEYIYSASELTRQLLGFARRGKYAVRSTNMNELIENQSRMFGRTKKQIRIHEHYKEKLWPTEVDRGQIEQVLLNIFVNAWQAMPGGGDLYITTENITIKKKNSRPFEVKPGKYVKISISDTGIGMDKETQKRIFDPFFTTKEMGRGTGLGLASVYGIIKNHGGFIDVKSEKGKGSIFSIHLPVTDKNIQKARGTQEEALKGTETLLIVDDEEMIIEVNKKILSQLGYDVLVARNGKEAVEILRETLSRTKKTEGKIDGPNGPDMVILDMVMPDMDGDETYNRMKEINPQIKVLLSSGYSINGHATNLLKRGCNGFIQKPFDIVKLSRKIREILDKGKSHD